ncbi:MAG: type II toxin-antitoxin system VapC family toxin [Luteolibacter sp.]
MIYVESSVLASVVMHDPNSGNAIALTAGLVAPCLFNHLLKLEVCNAIRLKVAEGAIDEVVAAKCERQVESLQKSGMWQMVEPDWGRVFLRSIGFSRAHTSLMRTRSFDILHVAAAVELGATEFWSFDKRQRLLAREVGLRVND